MKRVFPQLKAVALVRDKQETVASFLGIKGGGGRGSINHWVEHDGSYWAANPWDVCYPKVPADTTRDAISLYWDRYYEDVHRLTREYPESVMLLHLDQLGSTEGQEALLRFCGFDAPVLPAMSQANRGNIEDGFAMWPSPLAG